MDDLQQRIERTTERLIQSAAARGMFISGDGRVSEANAADLIGYAAGSLKNLRGMGAGPAFFNRPLGGSGKSYRMEDLARWIETAREETL